MKLPRYEQETVINNNAGEQTVTVYTRDKAVMSKLDTLVVDFPDTYSLITQDEVSEMIENKQEISKDLEKALQTIHFDRRSKTVRVVCRRNY